MECALDPWLHRAGGQQPRRQRAGPGGLANRGAPGPRHAVAHVRWGAGEDPATRAEQQQPIKLEGKERVGNRKLSGAAACLGGRRAGMRAAGHGQHGVSASVAAEAEMSPEYI